MGDLASGGVGDVDAGVIEQQSGGAIEFNDRLFVGRLGRNQIRLARGQRGCILQNRGVAW
jgi:hypothetical protein